MKSVRFCGPVNDAIKAKEGGKNDNYKLLLQKIQNPLSKSEDLIELLKQFREVVHVIDKSKKEFVVDLMAARWAAREKEVLQLYFDIIVDLALANSIHITHILKSLVKHFFPGSIGIVDTNLSVPKEEIFELVHATLRRLFVLIPMSKSSVMPLLSMTYPYMMKDLVDIESFLKNLLKIVEYAPSLRKSILELAVSKTLIIDLVCTRESIQQRNMDADNVMFEMDMEEKMDNKFVSKLDMKLNIIIQFVKDCCYKNGKLTDTADAIFDEMLHIFCKAVLPVHDSSHVQFIIFYMCSFNAAYQQKFTNLLWEIAQNQNSAVLKRQIALCYIASFYARAKFIETTEAVKMINSLSKWIHSYIHKREQSGCYGNGLHNAYKHGVFYAACQALFYIIIFRVKDIMNLTNGFEVMRKLQIERIVTSQMNPLRFCINTVINLFSTVMREHQIAYCDTIIEKNNRQCLPISGDSTALSNVNPLDSFFPFDPYLLKLSEHLFTDIYQQWEGQVPNDDDNSDDDESDDESMEVVASSPDLFCIKSQSKRIDDISTAIFGVSPGFSLITPSPY